MAARFTAGSPLPKWKRLSDVVPAILNHPGQIRRGAAVTFKIPFLYSGERHPHLMMKIVGPHRVDLRAAAILLSQYFAGVAFILGDEKRAAFMRQLRQLRKQVPRRIIMDRMRGIQSQPVEAIFIQPIRRVAE